MIWAQQGWNWKGFSIAMMLAGISFHFVSTVPNRNGEARRKNYINERQRNWNESRISQSFLFISMKFYIFRCDPFRSFFSFWYYPILWMLKFWENSRTIRRMKEESEHRGMRITFICIWASSLIIASVENSKRSHKWLIDGLLICSETDLTCWFFLVYGIRHFAANYNIYLRKIVL